MALKLGPLKLPWGRQEEDPYWDLFMNGEASDHRNLVTEIIRRAPESAVNPAISDTHSMEITSSHIKELASFVGADLAGIVSLSGFDESIAQGYPFAIVCAVRADHDPALRPASAAKRRSRTAASPPSSSAPTSASLATAPR